MRELASCCTRFFLIFAAALLQACSTSPLEPAAEMPAQPPDPFEQNRLLGRGINLGNALEAPNEGAWGVVLQQEYFDLIKQAGFQSVRLPIRWSGHAGQTAPYALDAQFLHRVDWAIEQALSRGLAAIIDLHHYEAIMDNPPGEKARFLAIWRQLAEHYRKQPLQLFFEILNEPRGGLTHELWNAYQQEAITVIRESNPSRTLLVSTANWGGLSGLNQLELPEEEQNLIVTVHYYNPFQFTHQGAEWVPGSEAWLGTTWEGTAAETQAVENDFRGAFNWAAAHHRPLNLGEFGAYSKADMASRARWTAFVARTAEGFEMSWHYWEFISGFGVYDGQTKSWREPLLRALLPIGALIASRQ